ncbi:hypothetical protein C8A05DRAFT_45269 [Staphylotrichum tortipilum]|uniref:HD domain-containing protein n=1 Tax=Staphylotrichum tortipilum TaxID=2831512 RepID=A0AAN6MIU0_9PEZI|nr:hypothetical protein C8A05DRAFT_45269 [Staphylotrichum longicolle]
MSALPPTTITELTLLYTSPSRHYHSLSHIHTLLSLLSTHHALFSDPAAAEAAIWFHDAIYDARAPPPLNETQSAELAVARLTDAGWEGHRVEWVRRVIEATAGHRRDAEMVLDMDLAVLGAEEGEFEEYEGGVRREYEHVSEEGWRVGRAAVLRGFLRREWIYMSGVFRGLLEERARGNLRRALARLEG